MRAAWEQEVSVTEKMPITEKYVRSASGCASQMPQEANSDSFK